MHFRIFHQPCKPNITKQHQTGFIIRHFLPEHPLVSFTSSWTAPIMTRPSKAETSANALGACPAFKSLRRRWTTTMAKKTPRLHDSIPLSMKYILSYPILSWRCLLSRNQLGKQSSYYSLNIGSPSDFTKNVVMFQAYINSTRPSQADYHIVESFSKACQARLIST